jgi:hypothetical protein
MPTASKMAKLSSRIASRPPLAQQLSADYDSVCNRQDENADRQRE